MRAGVSKINPNPFTTRPEIEGVQRRSKNASVVLVPPENHIRA